MMTKKEFKTTMKMDYMDAMATFARMIENASDMRDALDRIDDKCFDWSIDLGCSDEWMAIYSGLICVIDAMDDDDDDWDD